MPDVRPRVSAGRMPRPPGRDHAARLPGGASRTDPAGALPGLRRQARQAAQGGGTGPLNRALGRGGTQLY
ncbi:protein of unknown function (plasmid) [Cupriavidus taiwanensis]|uniref:Uncharacterized protein n=1 Tax=Cupriavidus taiwanensis TaxID=164546 RepID=A0A7Z7NNT1_9BURK|nr:protein of unknown function [Cupriavidus taiwanensis]SOZ12130.1 protein of unknown function [Cupriavidus taiwanensis]SOZ43435.1 protein of unknown function [Cupriavidus taiwanensis]SPC22677.1 protein of unknown function [Cupriavidus taiwanensis]SPD54188.1 protein of unknown function [Cupriavidus taiwanensis]